MVAAIIVTDLSPARTRHLGLQRLMGTLIGATIGAAISMLTTPATHNGPLTIAIGVLTTMLLSHLFGLPDAARLAGYVCGIVLLNYNDRPWSYAAYRCVETIIGITTGVGVSFIPKLLNVDDASELTTKRIQTEK